MTKQKSEDMPRIVPKLQPSLLKPAEFERTVYQAAVPMGVTVEDLLEQTFWAHVAHNLLPLDRIEVHAEDGSWYAELIVRASERLRAQVAVLNHVEYEEASAVPGEEGYAVKWISPSVRFGVVRESDNETVHSGCHTKEIAERWLTDNRRELAS